MTMGRMLGRRMLVTGVTGVAVLLAAFLVHAGTPASASATTTTTTTTAPGPVTDWVTFYGYVDNSPAGGAIAHPCIHATAGGVGTYANPITFSEPIDLNGPWCQIVYVPFLEKYFIHEDQCDPCGGVNTAHLDLWMGGDALSKKQPERKALLGCENTWTRTTTVIESPPSNEPVDTTPLFTPPVTCHGGTGD